jgi:predicted phosphodiesterase
MRLLILSDLHLEFAPFDVPRHDDCDAVILAGDIHNGAEGIRWAGENFSKPVIYVMGNHEYYGGEMKATFTEAALASVKTPNVRLLDSGTTEIDGVRFFGTTLWTDFELFGVQWKPMALQAARRGMHDYRAIKVGDAALTPEETERMHRRAASFLKYTLAQSFAGKTVVITHHCPHFTSAPEQYRKDLLTAAFASDMTAQLGFCDLWVHGHTHTSFDYTLGDTRVVCNPRGYPLDKAGKTENRGFNSRCIVEI